MTEYRNFKRNFAFVWVHFVCVCVCVRERERERARATAVCHFHLWLIWEMEVQLLGNLYRAQQEINTMAKIQVI